MYAIPIHRLIVAFKKLPGVGERTAERFVFHLLKSGKKDVGELTQALKNLTDTVKSCETCWDFSDRSPCARCSDPTRDKTIICAVESPQNLEVIEKTGSFKGLYHVLRGTIDPDNDRQDALKIPQLLARLSEVSVKEIILALNPDLPGETTAMFLAKKIKSVAPHIAITRLARGLPMGSDLLYADEITLGNALHHRTQT